MRSQTLAALVACVLLVASARQASALRQCNSTHPYVGFAGTFDSYEHDFQGNILILDDCTFQVSGFTYDGRGPAVYWYGAANVETINDANGFKIVYKKVSGRADNETISVQLNEDRSWNEIGAISLWCVDFDANFGSVTLDNAAEGAAESPELRAAVAAATASSQAAEPAAHRSAGLRWLAASSAAALCFALCGIW